MKITFDLLTNGVDSIETAISLLAWQDEPDEARRLKQAVLAVAHGVELLLKERLRRIHPVLIWENVDKFPSLRARTVSVDTALKRLINIGGLSVSEPDSALIYALRDTRNAIEHYAWTTTKSEAELIVGQALGLALYFAKEELNHDFFGYQRRRDDTFEVLLENSPDLASAFRKRFQHRDLDRKEAPLECEHCHTRSVDSSTGACELCGHWNSLPKSGEIPF